MTFLSAEWAAQSSGQFAWTVAIAAQIAVAISFHRHRDRHTTRSASQPEKRQTPGPQTSATCSSSDSSCTGDRQYASLLAQSLHDISRHATGAIDVSSFLDAVCWTLTGNGCCRAVWIIRLDAHGDFAALSHSGMGAEAELLEQMLCRQSWDDPDAMARCTPTGDATLRLECAGKLYGFMGVDQSSWPTDAVEQSLPGTVADHIALCLHDIHSRLKQQQDEQWLRSENRSLHQQLLELRQTQGTAMHDERAAALVRMAKRLAHDLNNALTPVIVFTDLLLSDSYDWSNRTKTRHNLECVNAAAHEAANAVRQLQDFHRQKMHAQVEALDAIAAVLKVVSSALGVHVATTGLSDAENRQPPPASTGGEGELCEALQTAIRNAVQTMLADSSLRITIHHECGAVAVEIADTRLGMSDDVKKRCRETYPTAPGADGRGIGMATAYTVATHHGSSIEIESCEDTGTVVHICLPKPGTSPPPDGTGQAVNGSHTPLDDRHDASPAP
jgi:signal transduction histidine kinase